jgi:RNA-binding protein PNO1
MTNSGEMMMDATTDIDMSNQVTTIDASVIQSRISMSDSLMKENEVDEQPVFPKLSAMEAAGAGGRVEYRRVRCPPHRYTPLRENWEQILMPLVEYLKLQVR